MFYLRFVIGGLIIAIVPIMANRFSGKIAGYIILIPAILYLSMIALYLSEGHKTTLQAIHYYLLGLPAVAVSAGLIILMLRSNINIYLTIAAAIAGWLLSVVIINKII